MSDKPMMERKEISIDELADVAFYLSGLKQGRGSLLPLGEIHLENLWNTIHYLKGSSAFTCERDNKS